MKVVLATGTDRGYLPKIWPYLTSIQACSGADRNVVFVSTSGGDGWFRGVRSLPAIEWRPVDVGRLRAPNANRCLQHGEFLDFDDPAGREDDLVIFTDGDIVLQRWFEPEELRLLERLGDDTVAVAYNEGPWGTLETELELLGVRGSVDGLRRAFPGELSGMTCFNTGVLIARRSTYRRLCALYVERYATIDPLMEHYAKQQWLLCYLIATAGFRVVVLPHEIHTHGCHPLPDGCARSGGDLVYRGKPVVFRHNVEFGPPRRFTGIVRHARLGQQPLGPGSRRGLPGQAARLPDTAGNGSGTAQAGPRTGRRRATVVVYARDRVEHLARCLKQLLPTLSLADELVIVNDGSRDETAAFLDRLSALGPRCRIASHADPVGVACACNGVAEQSLARLVVFLCASARPTAGWLDRLAAHLATASVLAVAPLSDRATSAQALHRFLVPPPVEHAPIEEVAALTGVLHAGESTEIRTFDPFCVGVDRVRFRSLGGFDEGLAGGLEALDLAWRARLAGYPILLALDTVVGDGVDLAPPSAGEVARFARKLEGHYGLGEVPLPVEIWGADVIPSY